MPCWYAGLACPCDGQSWTTSCSVWFLTKAYDHLMRRDPLPHPLLPRSRLAPETAFHQKPPKLFLKEEVQDQVNAIRCKKRHEAQYHRTTCYPSSSTAIRRRIVDSATYWPWRFSREIKILSVLASSATATNDPLTHCNRYCNCYLSHCLCSVRSEVDGA